MIIVDHALRSLEAAGNPIRVGMIGAGFMGQGLANQIVNAVAGMRLVAVQNRHVERAHHVLRYAGLHDVVEVTTQGQLEDAIWEGRPAVTEDALLLARSGEIDVLVEVTASVEFGARVVMEAMEHGKDVVLMNAELDAILDCRLLQDVQKDQVVTYRDVALPEGRLADRLRAEQYRRFFGEGWLEDLVGAGPAPDPLVIRTR